MAQKMAIAPGIVVIVGSHPTDGVHRCSPSVVWEHQWYVILRFAVEEHADRFIKEFGGERMHPSEKGRGKHWMVWRKGTKSAPHPIAEIADRAESPLSAKLTLSLS